MVRLVRFLRATFPDAGAFGHADYCPGGALSFYNGARDPFPDTFELACHIDEALGDVAAARDHPRPRSRRLADRVVHLADSGDAPGAWRCLGVALRGVDARPRNVRLARSSQHAVDASAFGGQETLVPKEPDLLADLGPDVPVRRVARR